MPAPQFSKPFDKFACAGDTLRYEIGDSALAIVARIERDDTNDAPDERQDGFWPSLDPNDAGYIGDGKTSADLRANQERMKSIYDAWACDEWFYCGIVLSVELGDVTLDDHAASLWGVECNYPESPDNPNPNAHLTEVANELMGEALSSALRSLQPLTTETTNALQALAFEQHANK